MKELNITEYPWVVVNGKSSGRQVISESAPKIRRVVASIGGPLRDQNANIIAAAPDLLEALLRTKAQYMQAGIDAVEGSLNPVEDNHAFINAAIAKALGE